MLSHLSDIFFVMHEGEKELGINSLKVFDLPIIIRFRLKLMRICLNCIFAFLQHENLFHYFFEMKVMKSTLERFVFREVAHQRIFWPSENGIGFS